jgi:phosphoribosylformylglycinamidine synthase subunit PurL
VMPTPVIGMLGLLEDVERRAGLAFREGLMIGLLWTNNLDDTPLSWSFVGGADLLGASQYLETCLGLTLGMAPDIHLPVEVRVQRACREAIRAGLVDAAHDCSDGGLAVALAEGCIAGGVGAVVWVDELERKRIRLRSDVHLFAEEPSRIIVTFQRENWHELRQLAGSMEAGLYLLGTTGGDTLRINRGKQTLVNLPMVEVEAAWRGNNFEF